MTYDALLALRGWALSDLDRASPDFMAAVRFALVAEKLAPALQRAEETLSAEVGQYPPAQRAQVWVAKKQAAANRDLIRAALYGDDDG